MGHQMGAAPNYKPDGQLSNYGVVGGDLLRAYYNGTGYELENNAKEGVSSTKPATLGANNYQGPGGGEFYYGDHLGGNAAGAGTAAGHYETLMGGLALLPGSDEVRATVGDPLGFSSGGLGSFNNTTGNKQNGFTLYAEAMGGVQYKSNGLGDLELICDEAPLQIGNYVWLDADQDGVQDPNEAPITNVIVTLWKGATQIASTTTNAKGEYYFSAKSVLGAAWTGTGADTSLVPNTAYSIKIQKNTQASINSLNLTTTDATTNFGNDQTDNDASMVGNFATINLTTGDVGTINHTYDFGFATVPACTPPNAGSNLTVCGGTCNTLTGTAPTTGTWTANSTNTSGATLSITTAGVAQVCFSNTASGTYQFIYTVSGCEDTMNVVVTPKPNAGTDKVVCYNAGAGTATMTASGIGTWAALAGNAGTSTITSNTSATTTVTNFSAAGIYKYTWTNAACVDTVMITVSDGLSGMAYRDYNSDGIMDANETQGVENIKVRLYDHAGLLIDSTYTNANGQYAFPMLTAAAGQVKIEFVKSTYPSYVQESFKGTNNGTDVQFVTPPSCSVNLGLKDKGDYCGTNPIIVTPIFVDGASTANATAIDEAMYSLNYNDYTAKTTEATRTETGSTWGIAYSKKQNNYIQQHS